MPGDLSAQAKASLNVQRAAVEIATLVTIEDGTLDEPLRYTNAATRLTTEPLRYGLVSSGETFDYALRNAMLPDEGEDNAQGTTIAIDNVVEDAAPLLRALSSDATVSLAVALKEHPDTRFQSISGLKIINRTYDMETSAVEVSRHAPGGNDYQTPFSAERQTRNKAPGLHR